MEIEKFEGIWNNGCIILDTCTLDYISRCEFEHAKTIMDILLFCAERVYVPMHVTMEMKPYFDNEIIHIDVAGHIKKLKENISMVYGLDEADKKKKGKIKSYVQKTINRLKKYSFGLYAIELEKISKSYNCQGDILFPSLDEFLMKSEQEIDVIYRNKTVKRFLHMIMDNTLMGLSNDEKSALSIEYKDRLDKGLPPGCGDKGKGSNSDGDLIIWKEILKNIRPLGFKDFLFITEDKKKDNNWYDQDKLNINPLLKKEVIDTVGYDAVNAMDLYHFFQSCRPFVDVDIDLICEYLINNNSVILEDIEKYFSGDGQESLMEEISDSIRNNHDGDWAIPYSYDINIMDIDYEVDERNETVNVTFNFHVEGNVEACYHVDREDNLFDAEFYVYGSASVEIPIIAGRYSNNLTLDYKNMDISVDDEMDVDTTDPLGRDDDDEENYDEYHDGDCLDVYDDSFDESYEDFYEDER